MHTIKPFNYHIIKNMNNTHKLLENIRYFMNLNNRWILEIKSYPTKLDRDHKNIEVIEKANRELRLYKNIYKRVIKNKHDKQRRKDFEEFVAYELVEEIQ